MSPRHLLALGLALLVPACNLGPYAKHGIGGPDEQLAALVGTWRAERRGDAEVQPDGHIIVDPDRTRTAVERLALDYPAHAKILLACAVIAYESGDVASAESWLDLLVSSRTAPPEALALRARIDIEQGDLPTARTLLDRQLVLSPDCPDLHEAAAALAWIEGRSADARHELDVAQRLGAPAWRVAYDNGVVAESAGLMDEAAAAFRAALQARPGWAQPAQRLRALDAR